MKTPCLFGALIFLTATVSAQTPPPAPVASQTPTTLSETHVFTSDRGFHFTYSSDWNAVDLTPILALNKLQGMTPGNCVQRLFNATQGAPASSIGVIGQTTQCLGHKPDLGELALGLMRTENKNNQLSDVVYGAYSIHGVNFWVMRAKAVRNNAPSQVGTIERVIAILPGITVYWSGLFRNQDAQKQFEHIHLYLDNGGDSELVPASAFPSTAAQDAEPTQDK